MSEERGRERVSTSPVTLAKSTRMHRPPKVTLWKNRKSPYWWIRYYKDGKQRRETTGIPLGERVRAKEYAAKRQEAALAEHYGFTVQERMKPVVLKEVLDSYRRRLVPESGFSDHHIRTVKAALTRWETELGAETRAGGINNKAVEEALIQMTRARKLSPGTRYHYITYLNTAFIQAEKDGLISGKPYNIKKPNVPPREVNWTPSQALAILDAVDWSNEVHRVAAIAMTTGLRLGDIARLDWQKHIDLGTGMLDIVTNKAKERVTMRLHPRLSGWLTENRQLGGLVIPKMPNDVSRKVAAFTVEACGAEFHPHALRYVFGNQVKDSMLRQKMLGHKTLVTTGRYTRIQQEEIDATVEGMYREQRTQGA